ncbi:hypothetical protein, partial [Pseudacidovorax intermedius]|uniref:hypothetical protein n=1 Tax=Pseudacidovorax intermedius TaxID=433924 RepID=UPI0026EA1900
MCPGFDKLSPNGQWAIHCKRAPASNPFALSLSKGETAHRPLRPGFDKLSPNGQGAIHCKRTPASHPFALSPSKGETARRPLR